MAVTVRSVRALTFLLVLTGIAACSGRQPKPGTVKDEAMRAGRTATSFPAADEDYFHDMDGGLPLTRDQIQGRNMWLVWTGGNDRLWDTLTATSIGSLDFLKTVSSHASLPASRDNRWYELGLVNEPCFVKATGPDPKHWDLWLDQRDPNCPPEPFSDPAKYPGVAIGARGKTKLGDRTLDVGSYYGEPTGVVGLRLLPNPDFDDRAAKAWSAERYYTDPDYYEDPKLVRPYRIGMSCAFCHVGPNPTNPPANPERPTWADLSSNVGAQYFWWDRVFDWRGRANRSSFLNQTLRTSLPGTLDTSLVSSDNINNPRTMNAVYLLGPRMGLAARFGRERLAGGELANRQFNSFFPPNHPLSQFFAAPDTTYTPRVLKDGSDSVGALGALNRVYLNIGLFSEEWLLHFAPLTGGRPITPIRIADAQKNSVYWQATELQTPSMASFFLASTAPHLLKNAPGGTAYLAGADSVERGTLVFADRCARCHSSKLPDFPPGLEMDNCNGRDYLKCWDRYWAWTKTDSFRSQMRTRVQEPSFLESNYLSTEFRIPSTLMQTNICSPIATNAIEGNIWDNFSSQSYKELPSAGAVRLRNPFTGAEYDYTLPDGGRGFTRPASLVSLWSTAPFLQNNSVGHFEWRPSVEARMKAFDDAIQQMLWPERRPKDELFERLRISGPGVGIIQRTDERSWIRVKRGFIPRQLRPLAGVFQRKFPELLGQNRHDGLAIGPIPEGTPISLFSSMDFTGADLSPEQEREQRKKLLALIRIVAREAKAGADVFADQNIQRAMFEMSKCPDYVINKGHYFGTDLFTEEPGLTDAQKIDLIAFLKTM
jgi:hypothetical protein